MNFRRNGGEVSHLCSDELALTHIRAIHAQVKGEYSWPRIHKELQARGLRIGKERVRKLIASHGIRAKTKRNFVVTTDSKHSLPVAADLVQRRFTPQAPNQLLCDDITYIATDEGWLQIAFELGLSQPYAIRETLVRGTA